MLTSLRSYTLPHPSPAATTSSPVFLKGLSSPLSPSSSSPTHYTAPWDLPPLPPSPPPLPVASTAPDPIRCFQSTLHSGMLVQLIPSLPLENAPPLASMTSYCPPSCPPLLLLQCQFLFSTQPSLLEVLSLSPDSPPFLLDTLPLAGLRLSFNCHLGATFPPSVLVPSELQMCTSKHLPCPNIPAWGLTSISRAACAKLQPHCPSPPLHLGPSSGPPCS